MEYHTCKITRKRAKYIITKDKSERIMIMIRNCAIRCKFSLI